MNKEEFIRKYKLLLEELELKPRNLIVGAGGVMLMLGVKKETSDMDLATTKDIFDRITLGKPNNLPDGTPIITIDGNIDIHVTEHTLDGIMIDGVYCESLRSVYALRKRLNRPKDQIELKALDILLNEENREQRKRIYHLVSESVLAEIEEVLDAQPKPPLSKIVDGLSDKVKTLAVEYSVELNVVVSDIVFKSSIFNEILNAIEILRKDGEYDESDTWLDLARKVRKYVRTEEELSDAEESNWTHLVLDAVRPNKYPKFELPFKLKSK